MTFCSAEIPFQKRPTFRGHVGHFLHPVESARIRSPFAGSLRNPRKGIESEPIRPGPKTLATVAPVRGPFLEPDSGGTIRHATVRDDLFRRNRLQFWSLKPGPRFTMFLGPRMGEEIAPPSLLPLLSLSSLSSLSPLSSLLSH